MAKTLSTGGARAPLCSIHKTAEHMQKDDQGAWFCLKCADEWLANYYSNKTHGVSTGGVVLPAGVSDSRRDGITPSFKDLMPNRRARRAMRSTR